MSKKAARWAVIGLCSASALWLSGCGSTVKLDDKPVAVESRTIPGQGGSGQSSAVPASTVAPVSTSADDEAAARAARARVIYFDFDSYVVKDEFRPVLESNAKVLSAARSKRIFVEGHTDERGGREYNLALGQKRAEAVVKSLSVLGVSPDQLEAVSYGKERPAVTGSDEEAWAKNRRVELKDR
ncbi:MAG: peptidoglycan-associated lipoprotein Pal [Burkholderiales bacterium]|nr:peptidoglycan-associated lipoprotein Pal [Burkholderiales bacterium]